MYVDPTALLADCVLWSPLAAAEAVGGFPRRLADRLVDYNADPGSPQALRDAVDGAQTP